MSRETVLKSPLDPHYTGHRDADSRQRETREWLKRRERELGFVKDAPSVASGSAEKDC